MRRRIYIDPESDLQDVTGEPYRYDVDQEPGIPLSICRTGTLYDDALWAQYLAACKEANRLRGVVCRAMTNEGFDDVERDLHRRAQMALDGDVEHPMAVYEAIDREAIEHAQRQHRPADDAAREPKAGGE